MSKKRGPVKRFTGEPLAFRPADRDDKVLEELLGGKLKGLSRTKVARVAMALGLEVLMNSENIHKDYMRASEGLEA